VATPGRLLYHTDNTPGFSKQLMGLKVFILDEANHMLDLGFRKDIERIIDAIPTQKLSMLFQLQFLNRDE
jgi:ATP-dependent RNA helicase MSS116